MIVDGKHINFICFAPCPVERPLAARLEQVQQEHKAFTGEELTFVLPSFSENKEKYDNFSKITDIDMLPDVLVSMGFGDFMESGFVKKFANSKYFINCSFKNMNENFRDNGYADKDRCYTLISSFPMVFLADMKELGELPAPDKWTDLLNEKYTDKIAVSGNNDIPNDAVLLTVFKYFGEEGIKKLARNVKAIGGYSKIVEGLSNKKNRPAIYALPYYFALRDSKEDNMKLIWPEDGAILEPVYMLVKKSGLKTAEIFWSYMTGKDFGELSTQTGFPVPHAGIDNKLPEGAGFMWVGWDFIRKNNLRELKRKLEKIYFNARTK
jgi:ABC-type Fe3+ transport system substrate-binding protein